MRDTDYAQELATAAIGECRVERLHVKSLNQTEIRFSWWPDGKLANRPLDLTEHELLPLLQLAFEKRVFSDEFLRDLHSALYDARRKKENPHA